MVQLKYSISLFLLDRSDMRGRQAMEGTEILRNFHPKELGNGQGGCHEGAAREEDHGGRL